MTDAGAGAEMAGISRSVPCAAALRRARAAVAMLLMRSGEGETSDGAFRCSALEE